MTTAEEPIELLRRVVTLVEGQNERWEALSNLIGEHTQVNRDLTLHVAKVMEGQQGLMEAMKLVVGALERHTH